MNIMANSNTTDISIIIPTLNGSGYVNQLYESLSTQLSLLDYNYEIIFVDDGSEDNTIDRLKDICQKDCRTRVIKLDKNYGQHSAIYAGIRLSCGKKILIMNDDMSNNTINVNKFISEVDNGIDAIFGWRYPRKDSSFIRKIISFSFNLIFCLIIGTKLHDPGCGFMCFKRELLDIGHNHLGLIRQLRRYKFKELKITSSTNTKSRYNLFKLLQLSYVIIINIFVKTKLRFNVAEYINY